MVYTILSDIVIRLDRNSQAGNDMIFKNECLCKGSNFSMLGHFNTVYLNNIA